MITFKTHPPEVGMVICTKDGQRYTNATIIASELTTNGHTIYTILTDFGNLKYRSIDMLELEYQPSLNWLEAVQIKYPLPSVKERLQEQIGKLQTILEELPE